MLPFYFARRIRRDRRYGRGFSERLGALPFPVRPTPAGAIWLHAVSVGEVISSIPLIEELRKRYGLAPIYVSCTTVAARELAERRLSGLVDGLFYAPLDYPRCVRRVLSAIRPALLVILETEIWPNLWREAKRRGASLAVVNGRISDRALPRYRSLRWFFSAALAQPDAILAQSERDAERFVAAGAPVAGVRVGGNLKYDFTPASGEVAPAIREYLSRAGRPEVWIAASTMPSADAGDVDEDDVVIHAFVQLAARRPNLLMILVPRRPERFDAAADKLAAAGVRYARRSGLDAGTAAALPGVLLLDTIGELSGLFALADVVFMGGTVARRGGHNILEPAFFGKPVIVGPHMENFAAIAGEFAAGEASYAIESAAGLVGAVERLLDDGALRSAIGGRARAIAGSKRGVTERLAGELLELYDRGLPQRGGPAVLAPLAALWAAGVRRDRTRSNPRPLGAPVISVGNITMGGSGKTPLVVWLAGRLRERNLRPAILTRGYRRRTVDRSVVLAAGTPCAACRTGDEAQAYVRQGEAHIGIGADRYETGRQIERELGAGVFLLDDGFQHWGLKRDLDIVLIDALDPFGGGNLFPRGRLREPLDALSRAGAIVITRTVPGLRTQAIESVIRRNNPAAPVFRSAVRPVAWVDARTGERLPAAPAPFKRVAAFCGLGNPAGFGRTVEDCGLEIAFRWSFGDHHSYRAYELARLASRARTAGVEALVTTEKDFANFPGAPPAGVPVYWLAITIDVEREEEFLALVKSATV